MSVDPAAATATATATAVALPPRLTLADATATLALVAPALAAGGEAASIDASALAELDTAALAVLLECRRRALADGRAFAIVGAPAKLVQLARLYGVDGLLGLDAAGAVAAQA